MAKHQLFPDTWIDKYSDQLLGYAVTSLRDRDTAKDMVQETFFYRASIQGKLPG